MGIMMVIFSDRLFALWFACYGIYGKSMSGAHYKTLSSHSSCPSMVAVTCEVESSRKNQKNQSSPGHYNWYAPIPCVCLKKKNALLSRENPKNEWVSRYKETHESRQLFQNTNSSSSCLRAGGVRSSSASRDVRGRCFDAVRVVRARAPPHAASGFFFGNAVGNLVRHLHHPRLLEDAARGAFAEGGPEPGEVRLGLRARDVHRLGLSRQCSHAR